MHTRAISSISRIRFKSVEAAWGEHRHIDGGVLPTVLDGARSAARTVVWSRSRFGPTFQWFLGQITSKNPRGLKHAGKMFLQHGQSEGSQPVAGKQIPRVPIRDSGLKPVFSHGHVFATLVSRFHAT